jgi:raffinose/stachyose/melibiose transport system permease protein
MRRHGNGDIGRIALFLAPAIILFVAFFLYPLGFTLFTSLMKWKGGGGMSPNGVANYAKLLGDPSFRLAMRNNAVWALASGFVQVPLAAIAAMILARGPRGWKLIRTIYFLPNVISTVALAMVWVTLYNPQYGAFKALLGLVGLPSRHWLGDPATALGAVVFQSVVYIGYYMIIILAAALSIPRELYEAAQIDGATTLRQELRITLPMLRGTLVTCVTLAMAYGMRHFESTFLMTGGGPAYATTTMGIALYLKMDALRYGEASAAGMILILAGTVLVALLRRLLGRGDPLAESAQ